MTQGLDLAKNVEWLELKFRPANASALCKECGDIRFGTFLEAMKAAEYLDIQLPLSKKDETLSLTSFIKEEFQKGAVKIEPLVIKSSTFKDEVKLQKIEAKMEFTTPYNGLVKNCIRETFLRCSFGFFVKNGMVDKIESIYLKHHVTPLNDGGYELHVANDISSMEIIAVKASELLQNPNCDKELMNQFLKINNDFWDAIRFILQKIVETQPVPKIGKEVSLSKSGLPVFMVGGGATTHNGSFTIVLNRKRELKNALFFTRKGNRCCENQAGVILNKGDIIFSCSFALKDVEEDRIDAAWNSGEIIVNAWQVVDGSIYKGDKGGNFVEVDQVNVPFASWREIPKAIWEDASDYHNKEGYSFAAPVKNKK